MSSYETFVNTELPRRSALLTFAITGYDGDPNSLSAPAILLGAPLGTYYHRQGTDEFYQKNEAGVWVVGFGVSATQTQEPLVIPIDYNDVAAIDPPANAVFYIQAQITAALAAAGATNFKNIDRVVAALPLVIRHEVALNLAAGVHRPLAGKTGNFAWDLPYRIFTGGSITLNGSAPSTWPAVFSLSNLTITAFSAVAGDPYLEFSGTPFTGLELRGLYAVLSTGQVVLIHRHTTNRLYVTTTLSPTPIAGVSTATVARPGTILRNSLTDTVRAYFFGFSFLGAAPSTAFRWAFNGITHEGYGQNGAFDLRGTNLLLTNTVVDHLTHHGSVISNGFGFTATSSVVTGIRYSWRAPTITAGPDQSIITSFDPARYSFSNCYFGGGDATDGMQLGDNCLVRLFSTVFDAHLVRAEAGAEVEFFDSNAAGIYNILRNASVSMLGALIFDGGALARFQVSGSHRAEFEGCDVPCVLVRGAVKPTGLSRARFGGAWFVNGALGGNTSYGIQVDGPGSILTLPSGVAVSGSLGDVIVAGVPSTYAALVVPYTDADFNYVSKAP